MPQDVNVTGSLQMPAEGDWPSLRDIAASQDKYQLAEKKAGNTEIADVDYGDFRVYYDGSLLEGRNNFGIRVRFTGPSESGRVLWDKLASERAAFSARPSAKKRTLDASASNASSSPKRPFPVE